MRVPRLESVVLCAALAACGGGGGGGETTTFVGTFTTTAITSTDVSEGVPVNFAGANIEALYETPAGWQRVPGQPRAGGGFEIPNVPASGPLVVHFLTEYFYTGQRALDFSVPSLGRRGQPATSMATPVTVSADGLSPWSEGDELQLVSFDSGAIFGELEKLGAPAPAVGAAALGLSYDHGSQGASALVTGRAFLAQLTARVTGNTTPFRAIERLATVDDLAMADGVPATITGTFQPVTGPEVRVEALWRRSAFDRFRTVVHPNADQGVGKLEVFALPRANQYGPYRRGAKLAATLLGDGASDVPVSFSFVNPYEGTELYAEAIVVYARGYGLDGKKRLDIKSGISVQDRLAAFSGDLVPRVGMPRSMALDGIDAREDITGLPETPVLSWQGPSFGSADQYVVAVWRLGTNATETTRTRVAMLYTQETSLRLPPGLLEPGQKYFVQVIAASTPGAPIAQRPLERNFPFSYGAIVSGVLSR